MLINRPAQMTTQQFEKLCRRVYDLCGINLKTGKEELVHSRLNKRLNALKMTGFDEYFRYLENEGQGKETIWMIDALTTNKTSFFREIQHFEFLREKVLPNLKEKKLRIWSAACSSGEEPYSIMMMLAESLPNFQSWDIRILATDICTKVLEQANQAVYSADLLQPIPQEWRKKYFVAEDKEKLTYRVADDIRKHVRFGRLNLMERFPMKGPFDVIFCRNVMIYFDKQTQENLVRKFYELIATGGYLFVGHSESLTGANHQYKYIQPATYQK